MSPKAVFYIEEPSHDDNYVVRMGPRLTRLLCGADNDVIIHLTSSDHRNHMWVSAFTMTIPSKQYQ
jgi:hypothetical protein